MKHFEEILQSVVAEASNDQLIHIIDEAQCEIRARNNKRGMGPTEYATNQGRIVERANEPDKDSRAFGRHEHGYTSEGPDLYRTGSPLGGTVGDDRHTFASGAMSSGKKPAYHLIPAYALERIARRFELGASKYGEDNWKIGAHDKPFILDRINHAIEHLLYLTKLVKSDTKGRTLDDDAAAVVLNAIFVMEWQEQFDAPERF